MRISWGVLSVLLCVPCVPAAAAEQSYAVLNIESDKVSEKDLASLTDFLTTEVKNAVSSGGRIYSWNDIQSILSQTAKEQFLGCDDDKCLTSLGGELGVTFLVASTMGGVGNRYILNLKLIDINRAQTVNRVSKSVSGDMGSFVDEIPGMVKQLLGSSGVALSSPAPPQPAMQMRKPVPAKKDGMVWIEGGTFMMGSEHGVGFFSDGVPVHHVTISGFYMDSTEVTQESYQKVMGKLPGAFNLGNLFSSSGQISNRNCPTCPVANVSWNEAKEYCVKVQERLPTEAEWEYACRAGTLTEYYWGDQINDNYAWHKGNSISERQPVAQKTPNPWGLYDMTGNVSEYCNDWYGPYAGNNQADPQGPSSGSKRVIRGGSKGDVYREGYLGSAGRSRTGTNIRSDDLGFRCVQSR